MEALDEKCVLIFLPASRTAGARVAQGAEGGAEASENRRAFAGRFRDSVLHDIQRLFRAIHQIRKDAVSALDLGRRECGRAGRVAADSVEMSEDRLDLPLDAIGQSGQTDGQPSGGHQHPNLDDCRDERGGRNDPEEDVSPAAHACSRALAC